MPKSIYKIALVIFFCFFSTQLLSQPTDPGGDPDDNPVPITGIEYLIAAGAAFGAKKLHDKRKKNKM
jgi:hypothetical protein